MFKRVLTAAEISKLRQVRNSIESRRFKRPRNYKKLKKRDNFNEYVINQTRVYNSPFTRYVRITPRTLDDQSSQRIILESYERNRKTSIKRRAIEVKRRNTGRYTLLNPPHGFEPSLPDPQIYAEGHPSDLLSVGDRALELKVVGGEFWKQFWNQASQMIDTATLRELIDFLEMKEDSKYRHIEFLLKASHHFIENVSQLTINEIASIFTVYTKFNSYSFELMETLSRKVIELLKSQLEAGKRSSKESVTNGNGRKRNVKVEAFDPRPLTQIIHSVITMKYLSDALWNNKLISISSEVLVSCRLIHNFNAIAEAFSIMTMLQNRLSPFQTQQLTMRAQLITAIVPERPKVFVSNKAPNDLKALENHRTMWNHYDEIQCQLTHSNNKSNYKIDVNSSLY